MIKILESKNTEKSNKIYNTNRTKEKAQQLKKIDSSGKVFVIDWGQKPKICDLVINTTSVGLTKDQNLGLDFKDYDNNKNFYEDKIQTAKFYFKRVLPRAESHFKTAITGSDYIMNFKFN